jgi:anthranilate synthase/aminodeoxychorismate synthase-like glutamine amidotransferase
MRTLLLDNYDSFTYNIAQAVATRGAELHVHRNDQISLHDIVHTIDPQCIVISPGPGHPREAVLTSQVILHYAQHVPILGVCLGHQAIFQAFGGTVDRSHEIIHGKTSRILHDGKGVFEGVPQGFRATRYHSLVGLESTLPQVLEVSARTEGGLIMGVRHKTYRIHGVQFHPESIASEYGDVIFSNFLRQ